MKKALLLIAIACLAICPVLAGTYTNGFEQVSDISPFYIAWNNTPGNGDLAALDISSTNQFDGSGCLMITLLNDTIGTQNQISLNFDDLTSHAQSESDTVYTCYGFSSAGIAGGGWWQFGQDNTWSWEPQGSYLWQTPGTWSAYTQYLVGGVGLEPYHRVGVQIDLDDGNTVTPPVIWLMDDFRVGPAVLPVSDWSLYDSKVSRKD